MFAQAALKNPRIRRKDYQRETRASFKNKDTYQEQPSGTHESIWDTDK